MEKDFEEHLLENWTKQMQEFIDVYKEPILDCNILNLIKMASHTFKQDIQVFFMTVDLMERYVLLKELRQETVEDPFLVVCVIIFISSKYYGVGSDLKVPLIEKFMVKISGLAYDCRTILLAEKEILKVFQYQLTFNTALEELYTFFEKFMKEYRLQPVMRSLCEEILVLVYCTKPIWFENVKSLYKNELNTFQCLITSKLYLPAGILIAAFKCTNYQFILDIDGVLADLKAFSKIHPYHIQALSSIILDLMN